MLFIIEENIIIDIDIKVRCVAATGGMHRRHGRVAVTRVHKITIESVIVGHTHGVGARLLALSNPLVLTHDVHFK